MRRRRLQWNRRARAFVAAAVAVALLTALTSVFSVSFCWYSGLPDDAWQVGIGRGGFAVMRWHWTLSTSRSWPHEGFSASSKRWGLIPYPLWIGDDVVLVFFPFSWVPLALLVIAFRARTPVPAGFCPHCRYDLSATTSGVCPECGAGVPNAQMGT
jgi:hypothetical protein